MSLASGAGVQESDLRCPTCASQLGRAMDELEGTEPHVRYVTREDKLWRQTFRGPLCRYEGICWVREWMLVTTSRGKNHLAAVVMIVSATPPSI